MAITAAPGSVAVRVEQLVDELGDLVERELAAGVRVEHRRVVDGSRSPVSAASTVSPWTLTLVCISAASWRGSAPTGCGSIPRSEATHGTSTQQSAGRLSIRRPPVVRFGTLPLNANGSPVSHARMMSAPYSSLAPSAPPRGRPRQPRAQRRPTRRSGLAAARVLVERDVEALDQVGPRRLDEPRHVLGEVLGGLGDEVAEVPQHLVAHAVAGGRRDLPQRRVEVLAVALEAQVERHVVDAGDEVVDLAGGSPRSAASSPAVRWTVWQSPTVRTLLAARDRPAEHRHRVDVLEQQRVGAAAPPCRGTRRAAPGSCAGRA